MMRTHCAARNHTALLETEILLDHTLNRVMLLASINPAERGAPQIQAQQQQERVVVPGNGLLQSEGASVPLCRIRWTSHSLEPHVSGLSYCHMLPASHASGWVT